MIQDLGAYQTKGKISSVLEGFQVGNCERQFYSRVVIEVVSFDYESVTLAKTRKRQKS